MSLNKKRFLFGVYVSVLPAIPFALGFLIATAFDCKVHEGFANPCVIGSVDVGGMVYFMFTTGWLLIITLPIGLGIIVLSLLIAGWAYLKSRWSS